MAKVGVIGAGFVGATAAYAMMLNGTCSEIVLIDRDEARAKAEAADIAHGAPLAKGVRAYAGDYPDLKGAALVIIAAGSNQKPGESRLNLLARNAALSIIAGKHATYYGIGIAVNSLADAIINDRHAVYTASGGCAFDDVCLSLPRLIGRKGILETLMPPLNKDESVALSHSAQVLYDAQEGVLKDGKLVCL